MVHELDELDLKIIQQLQTNGRVSITDLAKEVGSSRPTITNRLRRLLDERLAVVRGGLNLSKLGFKMACVGLEVKNDETRLDLEEILKSCPRVLNVFRMHEKANIHLAIWGEENQTINSTVESFRDIANVDIIYSHYLGTPIQGDVTFAVGTNNLEKAPCGLTCSKCTRYEKGWCLGCPATIDYKNMLTED
jgi:DNA-binding Lrp family transcriptional regulator